MGKYYKVLQINLNFQLNFLGIVDVNINLNMLGIRVYNNSTKFKKLRKTRKNLQFKKINFSGFFSIENYTSKKIK